MSELLETWRALVATAVNTCLSNVGSENERVVPSSVTIETPPDPALGDVGFPMFSFAKILRKSPPQIASAVATLLAEDPDTQGMGTIQAAGPYVNVFLAKDMFVKTTLQEIAVSDKDFGKTSALSGQRIMVEFSSPNTNKPLHLGHLRNDALGESIARILRFCGAEVFKVNIINNRGIHICKSMLAYRKFFAGKTPESVGVKSDRFVGDCYVRYNEYSKVEPQKAEFEAQELLRAWEAGDPDVLELWKTMNRWAESGIEQTYKRTGISFDKLYYESETYTKGREEILDGLNKGIFFREEDGSVQVDLSPIGLDKKVLLRNDGTALYMTQDIGTAIYRHRDWAFNQLIYVVGSEQQYHFKVLFYVLKQLGYQWADHLYHLSYGMVNLPEGKMKSREGTVVDGDDLINNLHNDALEEIAAKGRQEAVGDPAIVAEKIALGALHYFLLSVTPTKDMIFNPRESISFNGNTGPYLQYMGARISSLVRRAQDMDSSILAGGTFRSSLLILDAEWELIKVLANFPKQVLRAAEGRDPSIVTSYLYDVSKAFSRFYHDCPILDASNPDLAVTRLELAKATRSVLRNAMELVLVPFLQTM